MSASSARAFVIRAITVSDLRAVAALHFSAFPTSALTKLGLEAVRRYYEWLLLGPHRTTALAAFEGEELIAFMFGGTFRAAMTGFLHKNQRYLAMHVATHPWLLFTPLVRDRIAMAARLLRRRMRPSVVSPPATGAPAFGVLAIAVHPRVQGAGAGKELMARAEQSARESGFTEMQLSVADWNQQAIKFYLDRGWCKVMVDDRWTGAMTKRLE